MSRSPQFRSFVLEGRRFAGRRFSLDEDPSVRVEDIARLHVTLVADDDGAAHVVHPEEHAMPPLPGIPPPGEVYNPRLFIEEALGLGFDDRWIVLIIDWANRHRLFMLPDRTG